MSTVFDKDQIVNALESNLAALQAVRVALLNLAMRIDKLEARNLPFQQGGEEKSNVN